MGGFLNWLKSKIKVERFEISRYNRPYLVRWVLWGKRFGPGKKIFLHRFHQSDPDEALHDHPWSFWSLILWGGYWEITEEGKKWYGVGSLLKRPAEWKHRVELDNNKKVWTLVWTGDKIRSWGFWCPQGWIHWSKFAAAEEASKTGCE